MNDSMCAAAAAVGGYLLFPSFTTGVALAQRKPIGKRVTFQAATTTPTKREGVSYSTLLQLACTPFLGQDTSRNRMGSFLQYDDF